MAQRTVRSARGKGSQRGTSPCSVTHREAVQDPAGMRREQNKSSGSERTESDGKKRKDNEVGRGKERWMEEGECGERGK